VNLSKGLGAVEIVHTAIKNTAFTDFYLIMLRPFPGHGSWETVIALTAINDLKYNRFAISKVLVIAPKKVAEATWSKEAAKWDHLQLLRVIPVLGSKQKRIRALNTPQISMLSTVKTSPGWWNIIATPGRLTWWWWTKMSSFKTTRPKV